MSKAILITGPSGAGKTTTCKKFIESAEGEWAYINQDELRQLVLQGYQSADNYRDNWSEGTKQQWAVSIPICADLANRYAEYGINCIIDFFASTEEFELWKSFLGNLDYKLIVLLPDLETTVQRNADRDNRSKLEEGIIRQNHALFESWKQLEVPVIDNSLLDLKEVITQIKTLTD